MRPVLLSSHVGSSNEISSLYLTTGDTFTISFTVNEELSGFNNNYYGFELGWEQVDHADFGNGTFFYSFSTQVYVSGLTTVLPFDAYDLAGNGLEIVNTTDGSSVTFREWPAPLLLFSFHLTFVYFTFVSVYFSVPPAQHHDWSDWPHDQ